MCVLIGQQVCFHRAMKHENDMNDKIGSLQEISFTKEIKLWIGASYFVIFFVRSKNNNL